MIIQRKYEGSKLNLGLNWYSDENTFFGFIIWIPILILFPKKYIDLFTYDCLFGWRCKVFSFRFRIRRMKNFPRHVKRILYNFHLWTIPIGKQKFICSQEQLLDINKCLQ